MTIQRTLLLSILMLLITACSALQPSRDLPPILSQDEIIRTYTTLGRVQATREVYGIVDYQLAPNIREWGLNAIREEAAKMNADAVILPEVTGHTITYLVMPTTEYRATGVAIKFK
jgi:uncharacterized protein YbjQ (UPF0145 family)